MDKQFDALSKSLAEEGVSRREALRKVGHALAGVLMAAVGLAGAANAQKGQIRCRTNSDCGNLGYVWPACCNGVCTDLVNDNDNCGACGHRCRQKDECSSGGCIGF